jgi:hypothetical protein
VFIAISLPVHQLSLLPQSNQPAKRQILVLRKELPSLDATCLRSFTHVYPACLLPSCSGQVRGSASAHGTAKAFFFCAVPFTAYQMWKLQPIMPCVRQKSSRSRGNGSLKGCNYVKKKRNKFPVRLCLCEASHAYS